MTSFLSEQFMYIRYQPILGLPSLIMVYRIYSNKRRGAYLICRATSAALIRGRRWFKHCARQIYFFHIFIQRYTF